MTQSTGIPSQSVRWAQRGTSVGRILHVRKLRRILRSEKSFGRTDDTENMRSVKHRNLPFGVFVPSMCIRGRRTGRHGGKGQQRYVQRLQHSSAKPCSSSNTVNARNDELLSHGWTINKTRCVDFTLKFWQGIRFLPRHYTYSCNRLAYYSRLKK